MMRLVRGYQQAEQLLGQRRPTWEQELPEEVRSKIEATFGEALSAQAVAERIIAEVRRRGDFALLEYAEKLDGASLRGLIVPPEEFDQARGAVDGETAEALRFAAERVRAFHSRQRRSGWMSAEEGILGQIVRPIEKVGVYVPGGRAAYPSTVLHCVVPARVAGVEQVLLATPARADGRVDAGVLLAAEIAGVDRVFKMGGAQAIAAFAFGTGTVPKVDKIVGPGNLFVVLAKRLVFGYVDIDGLHGPTEALIVADEAAEPSLCAADLLAQAEHDPMASAILITTSAATAERVLGEVQRQLPTLERAEVAAEALARNGYVVIVESLAEAMALANLYAPEHLSLMVRDPWALVPKVRNAGGIFVGEASAEALGDYTVGPSHVMPTGGTARFASPLSVYDFLKITSLVALEEGCSEGLGPATSALARWEGLTGHLRAVELRQGQRRADQAQIEGTS